MLGLKLNHVSKRAPGIFWPKHTEAQENSFWLKRFAQKLIRADQKAMPTDDPIPHYNDVIMNAIASQITSLTIGYSTVYSGADQRKYQSSASLAFAWGIHRWPVNSPHKGSVTRKILPFDDVSMGHLGPCRLCITLVLEGWTLSYKYPPYSSASI